MTYKVTIRNRKLPKKPRVFDVIVTESGEIIRYETQNIQGNVFVDEEDVQLQIQEFLNKMMKAS